MRSEARGRADPWPRILHPRANSVVYWRGRHVRASDRLEELHAGSAKSPHVRRRGDRRGRVFRALPAPPTARTGVLHAGVRARRRRRRHLVLEPLSGRALRRREHAVFLFLRRRPAAGMALAGKILGPARHSRLRQPCRRPLRPEEGHHLRHDRDRRAFRRGRAPLDDRDRHGRAHPRAVLRHGDGLHLDGADPGHRRHRQLQGPHLPHRRLATREGRLHRRTDRRDRHWLVRHPGHPGAGAGSRACHRLPAYAELFPALAELPDDRRVRAVVEGALHGSAREYAQQLPWQPEGPQRQAGALGQRDGAPGDLSEALGHRRHALPRLVQRPAYRQGSERHGGRIRAPADQEDRQGSRDRRPSGSEDLSHSAPSGSASTAAISRPTTATMSIWSTSAKRRSSASRRTASSSTASITQSTASFSPPASTR